MPRRGPAIPLVLLALGALGFLLRTGNAATVFPGDAVVFAENDPYYHMRRVFLILAGYPRVPLFDPWIDFPHGAPVVFAPLFDLAIATLARLLGFGVNDRAAIETMAALVPPLLGALTCVPAYALAARVASRRAGVLAALVVTLLPAHVWYSRLGFVDHHVAVTLLSVTLHAIVLRALGVGRGARVAGGRTHPLDAALATLAMTAGLLTWNGFLLPAAVLDLALVALFAASERAGRVRIARLATLLHLVPAAVLLPVAIATVRAGGAAVSSVTLSYLHVAVLLVAGVLSGVAARVAAGRWPLGRTLLVAGALALAGAAAAWPQRAALERVLQWTLASDAFMSAVQESQPILRGADGGLDLA
ncbi:MAG: STT3 domain-containing protein, partial [Thermodesulfobacteriota bacterium]